MKNKANIFSSPGCLSMEAINRYFNDTMSPKERHGVEKHMLECELCADAVEGYALIEDKRKAAGVISEINSQIKGVSTESILWGRRIAASVAAILILASGLFYLNNQLDNSSPVAVNKNKAEDSLSSVKESSNVELPKEEKTIAIQREKENDNSKPEEIGSYTPPSDGYVVPNKQSLKVAEEEMKASPVEVPGVANDDAIELKESSKVISNTVSPSLSKEKAVVEKKDVANKSEYATGGAVENNRVETKTNIEKNKYKKTKSASPASRSAEPMPAISDMNDEVALPQLNYDSSKVSTDIELNFSSSEKRGIKSKEGIIYYVGQDKQILTAYENSKIKWQVNIIAICGKPAVGQPEIRYIKLNKDKIEVTFGKHDFASVDIKDGKTTYLGSD